MANISIKMNPFDKPMTLIDLPLPLLLITINEKSALAINGNRYHKVPLARTPL
jgi:hypothetical protein